MTIIKITCQEEWDALGDQEEWVEIQIVANDEVTINRTPGNSHVVARGSSHVVARGSSSVEAWGSSHVVARGSSHVVAWGSSSVEAWGSSHVVARGSSHVVAWGSSSVVAWGSSHVVAWDQVVNHCRHQGPRNRGGAREKFTN